MSKHMYPVSVPLHIQASLFGKPQDNMGMRGELARLRKMDDKALIGEIKKNYPGDRSVLGCIYPSVCKLLRARNLMAEIYGVPKQHPWGLYHGRLD